MFSTMKHVFILIPIACDAIHDSVTKTQISISACLALHSPR
uniref:Uncharacterized protein n=1 Tax=Arundo donax TaxID=35708 RepID=A0A0A9CE61_ARUDO